MFDYAAPGPFVVVCDDQLQFAIFFSRQNLLIFFNLEFFKKGETFNIFCNPRGTYNNKTKQHTQAKVPQ